MISGFVAFALALAGVESVATIVVPTGLDDADVRRLHARVDAQVAAAGGKARALSNALQVRDECLDDPSCARAVIRAADAPWLLWIDAVRAGPKVQIDARLLGADGQVVRAGVVVVDIAEALTTNSTIAPDILAPLGVAVAPAPHSDSPSSPQAVTGIAVASGGAIMMLGSVVLGIEQLRVINDPTSRGADKESAAFLVYTFAASAIGGIAIAGAGAALVLFADIPDSSAGSMRPP